MITSRFVRGFVEPPDQILEHQPHGDVVHPVRVEVDLAELGDNLVEPVRLLQLLDLFLELKALKNLADVLRESVDVISQVPSDIVGIALELGEIELAVIVEAERNPSLIL